MVRRDAAEHRPNREVADARVEAVADPRVLPPEPLQRSDHSTEAVRLDHVHVAADQHRLDRRRRVALGKALGGDLLLADTPGRVHGREG